MKLATALAINASGTSEGAEKGWETRGRHPDFGKFTKSWGYGGKHPYSAWKAPSGGGVTLGRRGTKFSGHTYHITEFGKFPSLAVKTSDEHTKEEALKILQDWYGIKHSIRPPKQSQIGRTW